MCGICFEKVSKTRGKLEQSLFACKKSSILDEQTRGNQEVINFACTYCSILGEQTRQNHISR